MSKHTFDESIGGIMAGFGPALRDSEIITRMEHGIICRVAGRMVSFVFAQVQIGSGGGELQIIPMDDTEIGSPFAQAIETLRLIQPTMVVLVAPTDLIESICRLSCTSGENEHKVQIELELAGFMMMPDDGM
jgi:hypothetical protein